MSEPGAPSAITDEPWWENVEPIEWPEYPYLPPHHPWRTSPLIAEPTLALVVADRLIPEWPFAADPAALRWRVLVGLIEDLWDEMLRYGPLERPRRDPIPRALRLAVYERDAYRCQAPGCGAWIDLTVDHVIPISRGGPTTAGNLQTMCKPCNLRKGSRF